MCGIPFPLSISKPPLHSFLSDRLVWQTFAMLDLNSSYSIVWECSLLRWSSTYHSNLSLNVTSSTKPSQNTFLRSPLVIPYHFTLFSVCSLKCTSDILLFGFLPFLVRVGAFVSCLICFMSHLSPKYRPTPGTYW